jgi:hypothetical protein
MAERRPPKKRNGQALGPRRLDGALLDVTNGAKWVGCTEATMWARVDRHQIPFHRWGGRIIFIRAELIEFFTKLDGCSVDEAVERERARREAS